MNPLWRIFALALALILSTCTAFTISPAVRTQVASIYRKSTSAQAPRAVRFGYDGGCRAHRGTSMSASEPNNKARTQRATALATLASVASVAGSAVPAHAESFAELFAQGISNAASGPGILAIPIVLGFLLATSIAAFIFFLSQPREYDD